MEFSLNCTDETGLKILLTFFSLSMLHFATMPQFLLSLSDLYNLGKPGMLLLFVKIANVL